MAEIECSRCGELRPGLDAAPFRDDLGRRIQENICQACWDEWLHRQMQLINHYALDVRQPEAREFLRRNARAFLFGEGEADGIQAPEPPDPETPH